MRVSSCTGAITVAMLATLGAPAMASPTSGPNAFPCKVLRTALHGTVVGFNAKHFNGSGPTGCGYDGGPDNPPWMVTLGLDGNPGPVGWVGGSAAGHTRQFCKPLVAGGSGSWYTKAQTGADLACAVQGTDKVKRTTQAYFGKGRWVGSLFLQTPPSGGGFTYMAFLLKQITARLPR